MARKCVGSLLQVLSSYLDCSPGLDQIFRSCGMGVPLLKQQMKAAERRKEPAPHHHYLLNPRQEPFCSKRAADLFLWQLSQLGGQQSSQAHLPLNPKKRGELKPRKGEPWHNVTQQFSSTARTEGFQTLPLAAASLGKLPSPFIHFFCLALREVEGRQREAARSEKHTQPQMLCTPAGSSGMKAWSKYLISGFLQEKHAEEP